MIKWSYRFGLSFYCFFHGSPRSLQYYSDPVYAKTCSQHRDANHRDPVRESSHLWCRCPFLCYPFKIPFSRRKKQVLPDCDFSVFIICCGVRQVVLWWSTSLCSLWMEPWQRVCLRGSITKLHKRMATCHSVCKGSKQPKMPRFLKQSALQIMQYYEICCTYCPASVQAW